MGFDPSEFQAPPSLPPPLPDPLYWSPIQPRFGAVAKIPLLINNNDLLYGERSNKEFICL